MFIPMRSFLIHGDQTRWLLADLESPRDDWKRKTGFDKIRFCAEQAKQHRLQYFWVDTCCIDKSDVIELQTAINSMYRWYLNAKICFVYLTDVSAPTALGEQPAVLWEGAFRESRWFTRGCTLQELIAPASVEFYSSEETFLGDKRCLEPQIRDVTGIPASALRGTPMSTFPVTERKRWIGKRQTKYEEDLVYSLLGIFDVHMPLIYGEGREKAWKRLEEEIRREMKGFQHNDFSVSFSLFNVPETQHFVAREKELAEMREKLVSDGSRRVVVLHGLGGIGKTQTAVTRLSAIDLQQDHKQVTEAVKSWLSLPGNTRWLMIFDNLDNPKATYSNADTGIDINCFLPEAYQGSVIITTRLSLIDLGWSIRMRKLELADDSLEILSNTSGRGSLKDNVDARKLAMELDGLLLALATAGAYLKHVSVSFDDYFRLYQESWARLHASTPALGSYQDRTLCSTWQLSYEQIQRENTLAARLLTWWAYFDNDDIWFELLLCPDTDRPAWMDEFNDELSFNGAMGMLHNYGFVEPHDLMNSAAKARGFSIHACVHAWVINTLNQDWNPELARLAVDCIASQVPSQNANQFWVIQRRLLPHAMRSYTIIKNGLYNRVSAFNNLGLLYADQGKLQQAEDMYQRALRGYEKAWGSQHMMRHRSAINTTQNLGALLSLQGKLAEAQMLYIQAHASLEALVGPSHKDVQAIQIVLMHLNKSIQG
ncbi:hypothetical protein M406DRAFT_108502 [Cryphonectria parasitica EP155]|uniref:Heterokaryon incompatibility domain-containing protein n=1 Tax=Cryphonectria parasitica (strain ATCC 38755 / EP155) TaxID=660469 RepID=A0A9P4XZ21_CRYP1|nr:uncharacterized protein M406DRAFT_108502 [Cryphonectria parasitica EP155]KAF3763155.1 hypothetical protein M406DRAFT_108502 [Cryphonectria parasitica EP155]